MRYCDKVQIIQIYSTAVQHYTWPMDYLTPQTITTTVTEYICLMHISSGIQSFYHSQAKRIFMMCPYKKYQVQGLEVFDGVNLEYLVQCSSRFQSSNQTNNRVLVTLWCYISQQTSFSSNTAISCSSTTIATTKLLKLFFEWRKESYDQIQPTFKQAKKLKSREMKEGWMKNDEGWMIKDDDF